MSNSPVALVNRVDQVKAFMLFTFFGGDMARTAAAAQCDVRIIQALAHDFQWAEKIKGKNRLDQPEGLVAEQENNRAANYTMAQRLAKVIEDIVLDAERDPQAWAGVYCISVDKEGNKTFTPKALVELTKSLEICHNMSYRALGDKVAAKAETSSGGANGDVLVNLAAGIYSALGKVGAQVKSVEQAIDVSPRVRAAADADRGVVIREAEDAPE